MLKKRLFRFSKWFFGILLGLILLITGILYFFKDEICNAFIGEINTYLNAPVSVNEVDIAFWGSFPNLSVDFNGVFIQDSFEGSTPSDTMLYTDRIRLKLNPLDLWRENYTVKSIEISPGTLQLKVNEKGENNYDIIKEKEPTTETTEGFDLNLKEIDLKDFRVSYINSATQQTYKTLLHDMSLTGELNKSVFNTSAQSNLKILEASSGNITLVKNQSAKLNVSVNVNQDSSTVTIPASTIFVSNLPFNFNGTVDSLGYNFNISGKNIQIADAANNLSFQQTQDIKHFDGRGELLFDLNVKGKNKATEAAIINCLFGVDKGTLRDPNSGLSLSKLSLDGEYSNEGGKEKEFLNLKKIEFTTKGGPFSGNVLLTKFETPRFKGNANGILDLSFMQSLLSVSSIQQLSGSVDITSKFLITSILEDTKTSYHIDKCEGQVELNSVTAQLVNDKRIFSNINGRVFLRNNEAGIDNVSIKINQSDLKLSGVFKEIIGFFKGKQDLIADIDLTSNYIDVSDLGTESKAVIIEQKREYLMPKHIKGKVYLNVSKLDYDGHVFENINGKMRVGNRKLYFPKLALTNGGADIRGTLTIDEKSPEYFHISSKVVSKNIDFKSLFKEWDNFNQNVITSNNIHGVAQANLAFDAPFDFRSGIISKRIKATIGIQIDNGRLKNVSAFKSITQSLRETPSARAIIGKGNINSFETKLLDLHFKQLKNTLIIQNGILTIPQMSIESSALDVELSGKHTFDNHIDYRFGFRFRDLKQAKQSEFGNIIDDGTGSHIFMRMYGDLLDPNIEWDKESRKEQAKQNREEAKMDAKSILKSEFGLFKNDTTVKSYIQEKIPHEEIEIQFNPADSVDQIHDELEPIKKPKKRPWLEKLKQQDDKKKQDEEDEFSIEG